MGYIIGEFRKINLVQIYFSMEKTAISLTFHLIPTQHLRLELWSDGTLLHIMNISCTISMFYFEYIYFCY